MLTLHIPTLLALLGTALMAVVIFAPAPVEGKITMSLAPPLSPPPAPSSLERLQCTPPEYHDAWNFAPGNPFAAAAGAAVSHASVAWPALVDARAASCDAAARLALVDALAAVRAPWADAILHRALDDEPDALVRDALVGALRAAGERAR